MNGDGFIKATKYDLQSVVATNIRATLLDRHMSHIELSRALSPHKSARAAEVHLSRRMTGVIPFSLVDLQDISVLFGIHPTDLLIDGKQVDPVKVALGHAIDLLRLEIGGKGAGIRRD